MIYAEDNMENVHKLLNLLINYIENVRKVNYLIKTDMNLYVIFLLRIWLKRKMNFFYIYKHKKINSFY